jgi:hypothetical protein
VWRRVRLVLGGVAVLPRCCPASPRKTIAGIAALQQDVIEIARRVARSCPVEKRLKQGGHPARIER